MKVHKDEKILVIADGAAFGPEMDRVLQLVQTRKNLALYLPESFEWLILSSGILKDAETTQILQTPSGYIDSKEYFSWGALLYGTFDRESGWDISELY